MSRKTLDPDDTLLDADFASTRTVAQLRTIAKNMNISLTGITKKADIIKVLSTYPKKKAKAKPKGKNYEVIKISKPKENKKLLRDIEAINKKRQKFIEGIQLEFQNYLEALPPSFSFRSVEQLLDFLYGSSVEHKNKYYVLDKPAIDNNFYKSAMLAIGDIDNYLGK